MDKATKAINALIRIVNGTDLSYNYFGKKEFHRLGKRVLKYFAEGMGFVKGTYDIRSNLGGDAVSGEVVFHGENVYIQLSQTDLGILVRSCKGRKDYVGGSNHWIKWEGLRDFSSFMEKVRSISLSGYGVFV
jgi:hypothetical protein